MIHKLTFIALVAVLIASSRAGTVTCTPTFVGFFDTAPVPRIIVDCNLDRKVVGPDGNVRAYVYQFTNAEKRGIATEISRIASLAIANNKKLFIAFNDSRSPQICAQPEICREIESLRMIR